MSEITDFYTSWLGCGAFGAANNRITVEEPITFEPTDLSNCSIWLDATDNLTITNDASNNLLTWSNKGLYGGTVYQNSGSVLTNTDTINGFNVLRFQPYADLLYNWTQTVNPVTCFVVMKPITDLALAPLPYMNFFDALSTAGNLGTSMFYDASGGFAYGIGANNVAIYVAGYEAINPTLVPLLIAMRNDITTNNQIILNNENIVLAFSDVANYNLSNFNYYLGSAVHGTEFNFAEFIIYERALSDAEMLLVTSYLTQKYNISTL